MRKILVALFVCIFLALTLSSVYAIVEVFQTKSELIQYNPEKAYNGYTLWTTIGGAGGDVPRLIDMEGNVVHEWKPEISVWKPYLWEDGTLTGRFIQSLGPSGGSLATVDWDGNTLWQWEFPPERTDNPAVHHDEWIIFNKALNKKTRISLMYYNPTNEEIWAAGGDPAIDYVASNRNTNQDGIVEVDMDTNEIIWEWHFMDHTVQDRNGAWPNYGVIADNPGKLDIFHKTDQSQPSGNEGVVRDWHHCNSLDYNPTLGFIAVNAKHWSEFYVIDHDGTFVSDAADFAADPAAALAANVAAAASDAGDFLYRFGNPSAYQQGNPPGFQNEGNQQMYGSHNIHWIKPTAYEGGPPLPGAGNFLIFNNGCYNPRGYHSEALEINPYIDATGTDTGTYVNPPDAGYVGGGNSRQIVWSFASRNPQSFYGRHISGDQRLPNGNTLICSGTPGHFFEVTESGEVVWEYINPGMNRRTLITDTLDGGNVYRAYRYPPDYPGFAGKDLSALGPMTEIYLGGAMNKFRESKTGFHGVVVAP